MPVPASIADLSLTAASNSPAGTDPIGNDLDNHLRALATCIRSTRARSTGNLAAAASMDIATTDGEYVVVDGAATISTFGTGYVGCLRRLAFAAGCTITHSASIILPGAVSLTVLPNDVLTFQCSALGVWAMVAGSRVSDGTKAPLVSPALTGSPTVNSIAIGYRGVPLAVQNGAYTFVAGDAGKGLMKTDTVAYTYTVAAVHAAGDVITVVNAGTAGAITLTGSGVTLQLSGTATTGNRTVAAGGLVTLFMLSPTLALVGGSGLS